jgi:hypothetical protein
MLDPAAKNFEHLLQWHEKIGANLFFPESLKIYGTDYIRYKQLWPYKKKIVRTNKQMIEAE